MRKKWLEMQGKTVNGFKILEVYRENKRTIVKVVCPACGKIYTTRAETIKNGKDCGCLRKPHEIEQGKRLAKESKKQCIDGTSIRSITMKKPKTNTSGIKGVYWDKNRNKWVAQIEFKGKTYYLGRYANKEDAREAREKAEKEMFWKFLEEHKEYVKDNKGGTRMNVKNQYGKEVNFDEALKLMDVDLRENVAYELSLSSDQEFFDKYAEAHKKKFGTTWEPDRE